MSARYPHRRHEHRDAAVISLAQSLREPRLVLAKRIERDLRNIRTALDDSEEARDGPDTVSVEKILGRLFHVDERRVDGGGRSGTGNRDGRNHGGEHAEHVAA